MSSSLPYNHSLMEEGSKILVVPEYWDRPYDLYKLGVIHRAYEAIGKVIGRDGGRGFGGIGSSGTIGN